MKKINDYILWIIFFISLGFLIGVGSSYIQLYCVTNNSVESLSVSPIDYVRLVENGKAVVGYVYNNKVVDIANCKSKK